MPRPAKVAPTNEVVGGVVIPDSPLDQIAKPTPPSRVYAKVVHLYAGLDLIGSKTSVTVRDSELEITPVGIRMTSKKTGRIVLLPWSNIKGCELLS